jgi:hypothetical protein
MLRDSLHMDLQGLQLLSNLGFGHAFATFLQHLVRLSILRVRKCAQTYTLALVKTPHGDRVGPKAVSSHQLQQLSFIGVKKLVPEFARNQSRNLCVFLYPVTRTRGFVASFLEEKTFLPWVLVAV